MSTTDTINDWFRERIACGAVARDTEAYAQVLGALPDLVARLDPPAPEPAAYPAPKARVAKAEPVAVPETETPPAAVPTEPGA